MSRNLRCVVCFLLICCILVNLSPLKAHALDPVTVGFVGVSAVVGVACIMQALGYMAASNSEPFTNSVNACVDYLTESTSFVMNGMLTFAGYRSGQLSSMYAMRDLVQEIWQWLFDSKTVYTLPPASYITTSIYNQYKDRTYNFSHSVNTFAVATSSSYCTIWAISNSSFAIFSPGYNDLTALQSGTYFYTSLSNFRQSYISDQYQIIDQSVVSGLSTDEIVSGLMSGSLLGQSLTVGTDVDISLGQIESPYQTVGTDEEIIEIEIAPVYIDLTKEVQEFPDPNNPSDDPDLDKKIPWLPIRIPSKNYDDTVINQTQHESWTGESEVEFDFDYGDSSGNGSGNTGSDSGTDTGGTNTGNTWTPPADHNQLAVDLTRFFPFCIPFDLFDFFTLLNADPVAPVFSWNIQDLSGQTYGLTVDLSQWDSVAQLFRRLQLFLFVCGLAAASRKYIKW